jgi:hypothetical protein
MPSRPKVDDLIREAGFETELAGYAGPQSMTYMYECRARSPLPSGEGSGVSPRVSVERQAQFTANSLKHGIEIFPDLSVYEADNAHAQAF